MADPSMTHCAESSIAAAACGSLVLAATPLAAWANVLKACAVSRAATPASTQPHVEMAANQDDRTVDISNGRKSVIQILPMLCIKIKYCNHFPAEIETDV